MKRKLLIAFAVLAIVLVSAAVAVPLLVDVDGYRPRIESALADATRRDVELGELSFSLFPAPSLRAAGVTIGEDPGFGKEPFLRSGALAVRVSLLPLLGGRLEIGTVTIQSPDLRVSRGAGGWNVSTLMAAPGGRASAPEGAKAPPASGKAGAPGAAGVSGGGPAITLGELRISDGSVTFRDSVLDPARPLEIKAREIDLTLTGISSTSAPMGIRLAMSLDGSGRLEMDGTLGPPREGSGLPADLAIRGRGLQAAQLAPYLESFTGVRAQGGEVGLDLAVTGALPSAVEAEGRVDLASVRISPFTGGGPPVPLEASLSLKGGIRDGVASLQRGDLVLNGTTLSVTGSLGDGEGAQRLEARIRADAAKVADLLPVLALLGPVVPEGTGRSGTVSLDALLAGRPDRLEELSLSGSAELRGLQLHPGWMREPLTEISGKVVLEEGRASIKGLGLALGRSRLEGSVRIRGLDAPVVEMDLSAPVLDVDEILAIFSAGPAAKATSAARAAGRAVQRAGMAAPPPPAQAAAGAAPSRTGSALPDLGGITVRGKLAAAEAKLLNLKLAGFQAGVEMIGGRARIAGATLSLYGGTFAGDITAGLSESGPPFTVNASLKGVDFNAMTADFSPDLAGLLFGTLDAGLQLSGRGLSRPQLKKALTGDATFSMVDGRLTTVGVLKKLASALESAGGRGVGREETPFSYLGGTFRLKGGSVRTEDLTLESADIGLQGEGKMTMDLGLDLELTARISPEVSAAMVSQRENLRFLEDKKERIRLDLTVGGTLMEPAVRVDPDMIRRALKNAAREKLGGKRLKDLLKGKDD